MSPKIDSEIVRIMLEALGDEELEEIVELIHKSEDGVGPGPRCRGCNARIVWAELEGGRRIPLDPASPVYRVDVDPDRKVIVAELVPLLEFPRHSSGGRLREIMVSHFKTCPKASDFSRSRS